MAPTEAELKKFLEKDLYDALRWLFEGAIAWGAPTSTAEHCRHQRVLGMYTTLVQARALYEFFFGAASRDDDARAAHYCSTTWQPPQSRLYQDYMSPGKPANKRVFHLVYEREMHSGRTASVSDEHNHLKNQVLECARDLHAIAQAFVDAVDDTWTDAATTALDTALADAAQASAHYGCANPFL